jgi:hypothetical protein
MTSASNSIGFYSRCFFIEITSQSYKGYEKKSRSYRHGFVARIISNVNCHTVTARGNGQRTTNVPAVMVQVLLRTEWLGLELMLHNHHTGICIWNLCTSDKSDVKSISKYIQVYDGIYVIY